MTLNAMRTSINQIDDDVLMQILSYLEPIERLRIEGVCWRWKRLIDRTYLCTYEMTWKGQSLTLLSRLLKRCGRTLRRLVVQSDLMIDDGLLGDLICELCSPEIRTIQLQNSVIDTVLLLRAVSHFSKLTMLCLCNVNHDELTDNCLSAVVARCGFLDHLCVKGQQRLQCGFLRRLRRPLSSFATGPCDLDKGVLRLLIGERLALKKLDLQDCRLFLDDLRYVCERSPHLENLNITGVTFLDLGDELIDDLEPCERNSNFNLTFLGLLRSLRQLQARNLGGSNISADGFLRLLAVNRPALLRVLALGGGTCGFVTDSAILVVSSFLHLIHLDLSGSGFVHDWSLTHAASGIPNLQRLYCCSCPNIRGFFLEPLLTYCPQLAFVSFYNCSEVTNGVLLRCLDELSFRSRPLTVCIGESGIRLAPIIAEARLHNMVFRLDWSPCADHAHDSIKHQRLSY